MNVFRKSLALSAVDSYLGLLLQLLSTAIIARLLTPQETGVFAVAAVFAALASTFRDFGVAEYLIQERDLTHERIRAALGLNIITSWSMAALLFAAAPLAGGFYRDTGIVSVMWVQSLNFLLIPFGAVTQAWFRRELNYRPIVIGNLLSNIATFLVSVSLAILGFGYMSLAWGSLTGIVVSVAAAAWFRPPGFPSWPGLRGIGQVFHFGKFASGIYVTSQVGRGAPELVIGRVAGLADVGMFSRGRGLVEMFQRLVLRPVLQVCLPYFAKSDRESGSVSQAYIRSVSYLTAVGWTFLAFLAMAAYPAIRIVYGEQWMAAVPLAQILCAACALELLFLLSGEALLASGEARRASDLQLGVTALQVAGLTAVIPFGMIGACWGLVGAAACGMLLSAWHLKRGIGLRAFELIPPLMPSLSLAVLSVGPATVWSLIMPLGEHNYWQFGALSSLSTAALWLAGLRLFRHPLWGEVSGYAQHMFASRRRYV